MEYIPGIIAYFVGAFSVCFVRLLSWRVAHHWSVIIVNNAAQANSQIVSLASVVTALVTFGFLILVWSISSHINYKYTEQGFFANGAAGLAIAYAFSQDDELNGLISQLPYTS